MMVISNSRTTIMIIMNRKQNILITTLIFLIILLLFPRPASSLILGDPLYVERGQGATLYMTPDIYDSFMLCQDDNHFAQYSANFSYMAPRYGTVPKLWRYYKFYNYSSTWTHSAGSVAVSSLQNVGISTAYQVRTDKRYGGNESRRFFTEDVLDQYSVPIGVAGNDKAISFQMLKSRAYYRWDATDISTFEYTNPATPFALVATFFRSDIIDHIGSDLMEFKVEGLYVSSSTIEVILIDVFLRYDSGTNHYLHDSVSISRTYLHNFTTPVTPNLAQSAGDYVYIEAHSNGIRYMYHGPTGTLFQPTMIPNQITTDFVLYKGVYYLLQSNQIVKMSCEGSSCTGKRIIGQLPNNTYRFAESSASAFIYAVNQHFVYPVQPNQQPNLGFLSPQLVSLLGYSVQVIASLISIPGARRVISPLFYFIGFMEDLYLYQFHDRTYGPTATSLFEQIDSIQRSKWSLVGYEGVLQFIGVKAESFDEFICYQDKYTQQNYTTSIHPFDSQSQGLLANSQNFFVVALPLCLVTFLTLRGLFHLMFHMPVSAILRKFDFSLLLFLLLFDGNIEQFSFYMTAEWANTFFFSPPQKLFKLSILLFGWVLVLGSAGLHYIGYHLYGRLNRHLMDNNHNRISGHAMLMVQMGLKNFYMGVVQSVARRLPYQVMMGLLLLSECTFLLLFIVAIRAQVFKNLRKTWIFVSLNTVKVVFISTLLIDKEKTGELTVETAQQILVMLLTCCYAIGILSQVSSVFFEVVVQAKNYIQSSQQHNAMKWRKSGSRKKKRVKKCKNDKPAKRKKEKRNHKQAGALSSNHFSSHGRYEYHVQYPYNRQKVASVRKHQHAGKHKIDKTKQAQIIVFTPKSSAQTSKTKKKFRKDQSEVLSFSLTKGRVRKQRQPKHISRLNNNHFN